MVCVCGVEVRVCENEATELSAAGEPVAVNPRMSASMAIPGCVGDGRAGCGEWITWLLSCT